MGSPVAYGNFTTAFLDDLASRLKGKRVLEIYAGNGYLASLLRKRGIDLIATSLFSGHDGHESGMFSDVIELEASDAVRQYGADRDILLVSWPTTSEAMFRAAMEWGTRPILFIGEMFDHDLPGGGYAGCASDAFFHAISTIKTLDSYQPRNRLDRARLVAIKNGRPPRL